MSQAYIDVVPAHLKNQRSSALPVISFASEKWMNESSVMYTHFADRFIACSAIDCDSAGQMHLLMRSDDVEPVFCDTQTTVPVRKFKFPVIPWLWLLVFGTTPQVNRILRVLLLQRSGESSNAEALKPGLASDPLKGLRPCSTRHNPTPCAKVSLPPLRLSLGSPLKNRSCVRDVPGLIRTSNVIGVTSRNISPLEIRDGLNPSYSSIPSTTNRANTSMRPMELLAVAMPKIGEPSSSWILSLIPNR